MSRFVALVKVSFLALLKSFSSRGKNKIAGVGTLVLMAFLCIYLSGVYSFMFATVLAPVGLIDLLPLLMAVFTAFMALVLTLFGGSGILFGAKDADFVLALPVSAFEIMLSKIMALYLENLLITLFMMLPCGVAYLTSGGTGGLLFLLLMLVGSIFLALIPTFFAVVIGYVVAWFSARSSKKSIVATLLYLLFFIAVMLLSFRMNELVNGIILHADGVLAAMNSWLLPFGLFGKACGGNPAALLGFVALTVLPFLLVVWLFSRRYKSILTRMSSHAVRKDYRLSRVETTSQFGALYKKEAARYFGSPMYLLNTGFGIVMLLGACIYALIKQNDLRFFLLQSGLDFPFFEIAVVAAAAMIGTVCTTSVSLSLEGNRLWILKAAPVRARTIFLSKIALNLSLTIPSLLIGFVMMAIALELSAAQTILGFISCASYSLFTTLIGMIVNLKLPKLDADNDTIVVKQSLSALIGSLGGMLFPGAVAVLYFLLHAHVSIMLFLLIATLVFLAASLLCAKWLGGRGERVFLEL